MHAHAQHHGEKPDFPVRVGRPEKHASPLSRSAAVVSRDDASGVLGRFGLQRALSGSSGQSLAKEAPSEVLDAVSSGGQPLAGPVRAEMETWLGHDFSRVRVHTDEAAHRSAVSVNAHAYTVGTDIAFQRATYNPASIAGRTMLAHELAHVVQHDRYGLPGMATGGRVSDPADTHEREAASVADQVVAGGNARIATAPRAVVSRAPADPSLAVPGGGVHAESKNPERTDNFLELLAEAVGEVEHRSLTPQALSGRLAQYMRRTAMGSPSLSPPDSVEVAFQAKLRRAGRITTKLAGFAPPGWRPGPEDQCGTLALEGANLTAAPGQSAIGGGGIVLYEATAQRFVTDRAASEVTLEQIRRHIDDGRALMAGVSEPTNRKVIHATRQPVTDHFLDLYGYETDFTGRIVAVLGKDNAIAKVGEVRFVVESDGSITKPAEPRRPDDEEYLRQEYQLSEVRFHTGYEYTGPRRPTNNAGGVMFWPVPQKPTK